MSQLPAGPAGSLPGFQDGGECVCPPGAWTQTGSKCGKIHQVCSQPCIPGKGKSARTAQMWRSWRLKGPILLESSAGQVTQLIPVQNWVQGGAGCLQGSGERAGSSPTAQQPQHGSRKQKEEQKTIQHQFGLKNLFQTKNSPPKKSYKKSRDKEWSLQKCSQIEKTHLSNPSTEPKARWLWLCTARDCLSEGMQRSSAPKLCSGPSAVSGVSPWLHTTTSSSSFPHCSPPQ